MTKFKPDFKSRFKILKGGKISLVISAMLVGSMVNMANAVEINDTRNTAQFFNTDLMENLIITSEGYINVLTQPHVGILLNGELGSDYKIENQGTISIDGPMGATAISAQATNKKIYGSIINSGTININGSFDVFGLNVGTLDGGLVENKENGTINISGIDPMGTSTAIKVQQLSNLAEVNNSGNIDVTSKNKSYGMYVQNLDDSKITNAGSLNINTEITGSVNNVNMVSGGIYIVNSRKIVENTSSSSTTTEPMPSEPSEPMPSVPDEQTTSPMPSVPDEQTTSPMPSQPEPTSSVFTQQIINSKDITVRSNSTSTTGAFNNTVRSYGISIGSATDTQFLNTISGNIDVEAKSGIGQGSANSKATGVEFGTQLINSNISNEGTIKVFANAQDVTGSYGEALGIDVKHISGSTIENNGDILVEATGQKASFGTFVTTAKGINLLTDANNSNEPVKSTLTNNKNINVKTSAHADATAYGVYADMVTPLHSQLNHEFELINDTNGMIEAFKNNELDKKAYSVYLLGRNNGVINVINRGTLRGNIYVEGTLQNSGTIELAHNANGNSNAYIKDFTNQSDGILKIGLNITDNSGEVTGKYSQLVTDNATFEDNSTIFVNVLNANGDETQQNNFSLIKDKKLENVVVAQASLTLGGTLKIEDNSYLLGFNYETSDGWTNGEDGAIHLVAVQERTVQEALGLINPPTTPEEPTNGGTTNSGTITNPEIPGTITNPEIPGTITNPEIPGTITNPEIPGTITNPEIPGTITNPEIPGTITNPEIPGTITNPEIPGTITNPEIPGTITNPEIPEIIVETPSHAIKNVQDLASIAKALDSLDFNAIVSNPGKHPILSKMINRLNGSPDAKGIELLVREYKESSTPTLTNATVGATTQIANGIAGIVTQRQNANLGGGLNSGDAMFADKNFWFKPFGSIGSQNDKNGISGFDVKTQGFGIGLDGEYKDNQNIGFGLFYTSANVDVNNVSQEADLDVFTTLVYGNVPVIDDKTNFLYQVGYSWQKTEGAREILGVVATSDYTSKTASLDLKLMRDVQVSDDLLLQPTVGTTYRHFTNPAYKENGSNQLVDKFTSSDLIVGLGTIAHYKLTEDSKLIGNINVGYDLHGKNQTITSVIEGLPEFKFDAEGIDNGRWSYQAGIGYEKELDKTNSFNISYDYQGQGSDFSNNTISAKYMLKF